MHISYHKPTATATAYASPACREDDYLGCVMMPRDTALNRRYAEKELRRMFPANEARLLAERTAK